LTHTLFPYTTLFRSHHTGSLLWLRPHQNREPDQNDPPGGEKHIPIKYSLKRLLRHLLLNFLKYSLTGVLYPHRSPAKSAFASQGSAYNGLYEKKWSSAQNTGQKGRRQDFAPFGKKSGPSRKRIVPWQT